MVVLETALIRMAMRWRRGSWWLLCLCLLPLAAHAEGITVARAQAVQENGLYHLDARIVYDFGEEVLGALRNGVVVPIVLELELVRPRDYVWDATIASLRQRYRLHYHPLGQQYMIENINSGARYSFSSLPAALQFLGRINNLPLFDADLIEPGVNYSLRLRASIEFESLPVPLMVTQLFSHSWRLSSNWYPVSW